MTISPLSLLNSVMLLGAADSSQAAETLDIIGLTAEPLSWDDKVLASAFVTAPVAGQSLAQRLVWLLEQLQQQNSHFNQQQVYLILPEQTGSDDDNLNAVLHLLMQQMPQLLMAPGCRVFPYGSAGALMALNAAALHLQQASQQQTVWLVAVDSLAQDSVLNRYSASPLKSPVLSEGAIAMQIGAGTEFCLSLYASDASPGAQTQQDSAVANLFMLLAKHVEQPLAQLYLPDCGDDELTDRWLLQYSHLHGAVDLDTELVFPSYVSGELGACGGLYRLWHVLSRLQRGEIAGTVAQLEISARQYRALTLFSPVAKPITELNNSANKDV